MHNMFSDPKYCAKLWTAKPLLFIEKRKFGTEFLNKA